MPFSSFTRLLARVAGCLLAGALHGQEARDRSVELRATIRPVPPRITIQWNAPAKTTLLSQKIYRRTQRTEPWTELASVPLAARSYVDDAVSVGTRYEYFVYRRYDALPGTASGWLSAAIRAPLVAERGRVILLVDDTMAGPLAAELAQFTSDLTGDGWTVLRQDVARSATVPSVRAAVQALYNADPAHTDALILFGHIPVPYSGDFAADGHAEHRGAWPADAYFGDMDGGWTDTTVNRTSAAQDRNWNIPGDGKFDQTSLPSDVELAVGRIDLGGMPAFGASETELLRQYLGRDHQFRHRLGAFANVPRRAFVDDHFGFAAGEAFAVTGWRSFTALFGSANVRAQSWFAPFPAQKYLCAYGCGGGAYTGASGVGTTSQFAALGSPAVFTFLFGSYFGDWDNPDNFLRAPLSSGGLTAAWAGRPHWFLHPMGLGETIGSCARLAQNNLNTFPAGYEANDTARGVHIALMGDPTLRLHPVRPPTNLVAKAGANQIALTWRAGGDAPVEGYLVSRATSPLGPFVRLRGGLVTSLSLIDRTATPGLAYTYLVRAVKRETTTSGSYLNPSQGAFSQSVSATAGLGAEINLVGDSNPITDGDTVPLVANATDFGSVEVGATPVPHTFTVRNPNPVPLTISSALLTGVNAADFSVINLPPSVAAGAQVRFDVSFHPTVLGARLARLTLRSNDANEAAFDFALGGLGIAPSAALVVSTAALDLSVSAGATLGVALDLSNAGSAPLTLTLSSTSDRYRARDSDSFGGPAFSWIDISATGTEIVNWPNLDDSATGDLPLGFAFPFYGTSLDSIRICTNGYLAVSDEIAFGQNGPLPNTSAAPGMIAPFWSDLMIDGSSHVFWQKVGGNFVVQYDQVRVLDGANSRVTCEAILSPAGEIIFQYQTLTEVSGSSTVGIQNIRGDDGLLVAYNRSYLHPGLAIRIAPPGPAPWLVLPSGGQTVAPGAALHANFTVDAAALAPGDYYAELTIKSNDARRPVTTIPVKLTVTP